MKDFKLFGRPGRFRFASFVLITQRAVVCECSPACWNSPTLLAGNRLFGNKGDLRHNILWNHTRYTELVDELSCSL